MSRTALVILAPGAEEMELVISVDVLRRAGLTVTVAGLYNDQPTNCSRNVVIKPDISFECVRCDKFDIIILPGGSGGAKLLSASKLIQITLQQQEIDGGMIGAICSAPIVLLAHGIFTGRTLTSHPSVQKELVSKYKYVEDQNVVIDRNLITSRGAGTAFEFALKIVEILCGGEKRNEVAKALLYK